LVDIEDNIIGNVNMYTNVHTHVQSNLVVAGHQWLLGLALFRDVVDSDQYLFTKMQQKWRTIQKSNLNT
jgi:hypothetical protein